MRYALALLCGAVLPLSLAPFNFWPLGLVSLAGWFWLLERNPERAWLLGWLYGLGKYGVGASWVYVSIHVYGNAPPPLAGALVAVFVATLALFPLLTAWLFGRWRSGRPLADALLFALLVVLVDWLLTWFLTGFPWLFAGYAHLTTPLAGLAPVGGVLLVTGAVALGASMAVAALVAARRRQRAVAAAAVVLGLLPWLVGAVLDAVDWVSPRAAGEVALVQGNIDQSLKWQADNRLPILRTYMDLSEAHWGVDLMIWPEAAVTFVAHEATDLLQALDARAESSGTALVLGIPSARFDARAGWSFRNTALALGNGSGEYLKRRLVPFGEYVPLEAALRGAIELFDLPMSHTEPGPWHQPLLQVNGLSALMAICYEVVYPELVRAQAADADLLLTISNDAWFGRSIGPLQHLQMAQMRALENGRWMLRATNTGVTAVVDHRGRLRDRFPQFQPGVLVGNYQVMAGTTPFTRYGQLPLLVLLFVLLALHRVRARRR